MADYFEVFDAIRGTTGSENAEKCAELLEMLSADGKTGNYANLKRFVAETNIEDLMEFSLLMLGVLAEGMHIAITTNPFAMREIQGEDDNEPS